MESKGRGVLDTRFRGYDDLLWCYARSSKFTKRHCDHAGIPVLAEMALRVDDRASCRSAGRDRDWPMWRSITLACLALCSSSQRPNAAGDNAGA